MPQRKTLNEDLFYRGSSANLPRLHTCENKVPFWDNRQFAVTKGINTWTVILVRYSGPFLKWSKEELNQMDQRTKPNGHA